MAIVSVTLPHKTIKLNNENEHNSMRNKGRLIKEAGESLEKAKSVCYNGTDLQAKTPCDTEGYIALKSLSSQDILTAKVTANTHDKTLYKATQPNNKNERTRERRGKRPTGEGEEEAKTGGKSRALEP